MYSYDEALEATLEYFNNDELAAKVFVDKYALRDNDKNILEKTPDDMHRRIAREIARVEQNKFAKPLNEQEVFEFLKGFHRIVPQGSPLYGIGNKHQYVTLSNCYVLDSPLDSYAGILWTDEQVAQVSKRRGGVGMCLNNLRPKDQPTHNSSRTTSGLASWMQRYSNTSREVGQDGRRGAQMQILSVHHPELDTFLTIKEDKSKVTGSNISVALTDEFLDAVLHKKDYEQRWPVDSQNPIIRQTVPAIDVWNKIIKMAHSNGEPGLLFWDTIIRDSPADQYADLGFRTIATNPCSELPLSVLDSCRLLLLNLYSYVRNPFTKTAYFDYKAFFEDVRIAQRLLDDIIDLEIECIDRIISKIDSDPEPAEVKARERSLWVRVKQNCVNGRRTGLGTTALGDTLAALGIKYGSAKSIVETDKIFKTLKFGSYYESVMLAKELGPFPLWDWERDSNCPFIQRMGEEKLDFGGLGLDGAHLLSIIEKYGRRNIANLTNAPAGSISIECQTTSGIEPLFLPFHIRKKKGNPGDEHFRSDEVDQNGDHWMHFTVYHPKLQAWMNYREQNGLSSKFEDSPWFGCCANDIDWKQRVKLQAAAQRHIDHAISSTINLPEDVPVEKVAEIYEAAWKAGCKGITVYRDGSRTGVLVADTQKKVEDRPRELACDVYHITVEGVHYFVLVGLLNGQPYEVFAGKNGFLNKSIKAGRIIRKRKGFYKAVFDDDEETELAPITATCTEYEEIITRLTSALLRSGANMHLIVKQLEKVQGEMHGFSRSLARTLKKYIPDGADEGEKCPECKVGDLIRAEGCILCKNCGFSKCL